MNSELGLDLRHLLADVLELDGPERLPSAPSMHNIPEWDSFAHVALLHAVETVFGVALPPEDIERTLSLTELEHLIIDRRAGKAGGQSQVLPAPLAELWESLWRDTTLAEDGLIYVHSRSGPLLRATGSGLSAFIEQLRGPAGQRTLAFPAFSFSSRSYPEYLRTRPLFSVRDTPPRTGLLPARAMNMAEARRSAHPLLSDLALGPRAETLVATAHLEAAPFHAGSVPAKLVEGRAHVLGLGVDIATNAFIHWADDAVRERLPFPLYLPEPVGFEIEHADGRRERRAYLAYDPAMTRRIKPRALRPFFAERPDILVEADLDGIPFYRLDLARFLERCGEIAREHLDAGKLPPWYPD